MFKLFAVACSCALLTYLLSQDLAIEQDVTRSLQGSSPAEEAAYRAYHQSGFFNEKIFVRDQSLTPSEHEAVVGFLAARGYQKTALWTGSASQNAALLELLPFLPAAALARRFHTDYVNAYTERLLQAVSFPGSGALLNDLLQDPFQLKTLLIDSLLGQAPQVAPTPAPDEKTQSGSIESFTRQGPLDYLEVEQVYEHLSALGGKLAFIGGDFFSLSNYLAIRHDINTGILVSLLLNLLLVWYFCRSVRLLGYFALGSWVSYVCGLGLVKLVHEPLYAIVLAFTSTFIGFNNEYLVHLSGLRKGHIPAAIVGLGSAIGTTLIGFVVLLFGDSLIIRQMALVSIGGMVGFLLFMLLFQDKVREITFRPLALPCLVLSKRQISVLFGLALACLILLPKPSMHTNVEDFSYQSPSLREHVAAFSEGASSARTWQNVYGVPVTGGVLASWTELVATHPMGFHPLRFYQDPTTQRQVLDSLRANMSEWLPKIQASLAAYDLKLPAAAASASVDPTPLPAEAYLEVWNRLSPTPWFHAGATPYLYVVAEKPLAQHPDLLPLAPKLRINALLTSLQQNMSLLFLCGLGLMFAYLIPWQRRLARVLYIFTPLLWAAAAIIGVLALLGRSLNLIHIMGFSLVIALALDYAAVMVSSHFSRHEQSKVLLTGASALVSFGVLAFAEHPVLRDLGLVVALGALVALAFALFIHMDDGEETA